MLVRDVMTTNVVTIPSNTLVGEARKIMEEHEFERLPVVDRGKLVGIVTKNLLQRAGPSTATSLSVWEINYLMAKMTVKEIMKKDVITVSPDMTVEAAAAKAQENRVGATPVLEDGRLVGIVSTNDYFYRILNPLLGINESGERIIVYGADTPDQVCKIMDVLKSHSIGMKAVLTLAAPEAAHRDLLVHLDTADATKAKAFTSELKQIGFHLDER